MLIITTIISNVVHVDFWCFDICKCTSKFDDIWYNEISVDIATSCLNDIGDFCWTCDDACWEWFFFYSIDDFLLAIGAIHVTCRMTRSRISESCFTVKGLKSFFYWKYRISIIIIRVFIVIEIFFYINLNSSKSIYNISKRSKVYHHIMMNWLSCDFWYLVRKRSNTFFLSNSNWIEGIYLSSSFSCSIVDVEVSWNRDDCYRIFLFIQWCEHDRISKLSCLMSRSSDTYNQYIGDSFFDRESSCTSWFKYWCLPIWIISCGTNLYISDSLNDIINSENTSEYNEKYSNKLSYFFLWWKNFFCFINRGRCIYFWMTWQFFCCEFWHGLIIEKNHFLSKENITFTYLFLPWHKAKNDYILSEIFYEKKPTFLLYFCASRSRPHQWDWIYI